MLKRFLPGALACLEGLPNFVGAGLRPTVEHAPTLRTLCCLVTCSRVARIGYILFLPIAMGSGISTPDRMMVIMELEILHVISKNSRKFEEKHRRAFPLLLWKASVSSILRMVRSRKLYRGCPSVGKVTLTYTFPSNIRGREIYRSIYRFVTRRSSSIASNLPSDVANLPEWLLGPSTAAKA